LLVRRFRCNDVRFVRSNREGEYKVFVYACTTPVFDRTGPTEASIDSIHCGSNRVFFPDVYVQPQSVSCAKGTVMRASGDACTKDCPAGLQCFGGPLVIPAAGHCLVNATKYADGYAPGNAVVKRCNPEAACLGASVARAGEPVLQICAEGYRESPVPGSGDACCSVCEPGHCRFAMECLPCPKGTFRVWALLMLTVFLVALGAVFYRFRHESVYLFPIFIVVFRMSQAMAFIAVDVGDTCTEGYLFPLETALLTPFTGFYDYFAATTTHASALGRLWSQTVFTLFYLVPFMMTPGILLLRASRAGGVLPAGELAPQVAAKRALLAWFWIMLIPLAVVGSAQLSCGKEGATNYPDTSCATRSYLLVALASLLIVVTVMVAFLMINRKVEVLVRTPSAPEEEFRVYAFLYGAANPEQGLLEPLSIDVILAIVVALFRAMYRGLDASGSKTVVMIGFVGPIAALGFLAFRIVSKGGAMYRSRPFAFAYLCGLGAVAMAIATRNLRSCVVRGTARAVNVSSVFMLACYVAFLALAGLAAWHSRSSRGTIIVHEDVYAAMNEDGTVPSARELAELAGPDGPIPLTIEADGEHEERRGGGSAPQGDEAAQAGGAQGATRAQAQAAPVVPAATSASIRPSQAQKKPKQAAVGKKKGGRTLLAQSSNSDEEIDDSDENLKL
jgi:hypothetical protein